MDARARSPLGTWYVYAHPSAGTPPPRVLREIADFVGLHRTLGAARKAARQDAADRLAVLLARGRAQDTVVGAALAECGLPGEGPLVVLTVRAPDSPAAQDGAGIARWALAEALRTVVDLPFVVGCDGEGTAVAVLATTPGATEALAAGLAPVWRRLQALAPATALRAGVSEAVPSGGSWVRTAEQLHVHVNTVHYRIQRIEHLTGKDLSRLEDRIDLRTALLCA
ncbi:helix-turn-helix domain-containing protein [Streptomyces sp. ICBB 8177]|uniref:helix-turn-helix domain-containing protein n=1 Tax=Streptomyces sp. ICBB 8177 TaxID=563922 RepID=UPI001F547CAE|nr:helix-turn-helix domain-containing protein [Streptomyces sp. ICBB 8177]